MRKAAKVDGNHQSIVSGLRKAGCRVLSLAAVGHGCPDLLLYYRNTLFLFEVKDGSLPPSKRQLTGPQKVFHEIWPVHVVTSLEEALTVVGATRGALK